jgi:hypothetical protein
VGFAWIDYTDLVEAIESQISVLLNPSGFGGLDPLNTNSNLGNIHMHVPSPAVTTPLAGTSEGIVTPTSSTGLPTGTGMSMGAGMDIESGMGLGISPYDSLFSNYHYEPSWNYHTLGLDLEGMNNDVGRSGSGGGEAGGGGGQLIFSTWRVLDEHCQLFDTRVFAATGNDRLHTVCKV